MTDPAAPAVTPYLAMHGVSKSYPGVQALSGVDFDVMNVAKVEPMKMFERVMGAMFSFASRTRTSKSAAPSASRA